MYNYFPGYAGFLESVKYVRHAFHRILPGLDVDGDGHSPVEVPSGEGRIAMMETQKYIPADVLMKEIFSRIVIVMGFPE